MFLDEVELQLAGGRGGAGSNSLRREKFVPRGGPDGGDGGRGGDVYLVADPGVSSLQRYQQERSFRAGAGGAGAAARKHGADGESLQLPVPCGTIVYQMPERRLVADLDRAGTRYLAAPGGRGGRGNTHFATPAAQAPRRREMGEPGAAARLHLELRLIADLGLVGLPNAGKSSLLARMTGARPKIADYPFTTLAPNLGVAELEGGATVTVADVPGLIEGAHLGAGLGTGFLRHLERTRTLVHVVDGGGGPEAAVAALAQVDSELRGYPGTVKDKPLVVVVNKVDLLDAALVPLVLDAVRSHSPEGTPVVPCSALTGEGVKAVLDVATERLAAPSLPLPVTPGGYRLYRGPQAHDRSFTVERVEAGFRVTGEEPERLVARTDLDDESAVAVLQRSLKRLGVEAELTRAGARLGDDVEIGSEVFTFVPEEPAE